MGCFKLLTEDVKMFLTDTHKAVENYKMISNGFQLVIPTFQNGIKKRQLRTTVKRKASSGRTNLHACWIERQRKTPI